MIEDFCEKLREKRKELGLDLEEIVEKTKLHPSVIKAIESGNLEDISPIYLKGFIKIYASFLGVEITDELQEIFPIKESTRSFKPGMIREKKIIDLSKIFTPKVKKNIILIITFVFAFAIAFFLLTSLVNFVKKRVATLPKKRPEAVKSTPKRPSLVGSKKTQETKEITTSLRFKRDCFVRVKLDGRVVFEGILRKGALESWQAKKEIEFKISDGSSVDVEVNGELLPPLTKIRKRIKSLKITAQGVSIVQ